VYPADRELRWQDGERLIRFGRSALADAPSLLAERGFDSYALLTTERAAAAAPVLAAGAVTAAHVPHGPVPEAAAAIRQAAGGRPLVALGGGRVIDAAKAVAAADGLPLAAVPTTLAGAEMNGHHRPLPGFEDAPRRRPVLVIADPSLMASLPPAALTATALNALAHAVEALYTPSAGPLAEAAGLEAARQLSHGLRTPDTAALSLGGLLAGYALGIAGFAVHHVLGQTLVRTAGTPHAETNAVLLPHVVAAMASRAPREIELLGEALGRPGDAAGAVAELAAGTGVHRLRDLGVTEVQLPAVADAAMRRRDELDRTPGGLTREDVLHLLHEAM
jgi:alcohol dehydrogenase class IV